MWQIVLMRLRMRHACKNVQPSGHSTLPGRMPSRTRSRPAQRGDQCGWRSQSAAPNEVGLHTHAVPLSSLAWSLTGVTFPCSVQSQYGWRGWVSGAGPGLAAFPSSLRMWRRVARLIKYLSAHSCWVMSLQEEGVGWAQQGGRCYSGLSVQVARPP